MIDIKVKISILLIIISLCTLIYADEPCVIHDDQYYIDKYHYYDEILYEPELHFSSPTLSLKIYEDKISKVSINIFNNDLYFPELYEKYSELYIEDYKSDINKLSGVLLGYKLKNEMVILDDGRLHYYRNNILKNVELINNKEEYINKYIKNKNIFNKRNKICKKAYNILNVLVDNPKDYKLKNSVWKKNMLPNTLPYLPCAIFLFENDNAKKSISIQISWLDSSVSEIYMW